MNNKELREIRRRIQPGKNNISHLYGCYVNSATREVISSFDEPVNLLSEQEQLEYFKLLSKALSGGMGKATLASAPPRSRAARSTAC